MQYPGKVNVSLGYCSGMPEMESDFRDKVKDRLGDPDIDEKFADCLRSFKSKIVTAAQFRILVIFLSYATFLYLPQNFDI